MSNGEELFALREDAASRPSFELALRGYDKRQVDHYVEQSDREIATLTTERERALRQVKDLRMQLHQVQSELTELRQRPPQIDRASFRDLGPTVDQIMALAEKQASEITDAAAQRAADQRAEAEQALLDAREQAEQTLRELEEELAARRAEQERFHEERRAAAEGELADIRDLAERLRADGEAARESAHQEAEATRAQTQQELAELQASVEQEVEERRQAMAQMQAELDAAQQQLAQTRHEQAGVEYEVSQVHQRLGDARQDLTAELSRLEEVRREADATERHAKAVRARVQRETKRMAELAAAAVLAAAEGGSETAEYPIVVPSQRNSGLPAEQPAPVATGQSGGEGVDLPVRPEQESDPTLDEAADRAVEQAFGRAIEEAIHHQAIRPQAGPSGPVHHEVDQQEPDRDEAGGREAVHHESMPFSAFHDRSLVDQHTPDRPDERAQPPADRVGPHS